MDMNYKEFMADLSVMLDKKLEQALEKKLEEKLEEKLAPIRADIIILKEQVIALNERMDRFEIRLDALELKVEGMQKDIAFLKDGQNRLWSAVEMVQAGQSKIWSLLETVQEDNRALGESQENQARMIENEVLTNIRLLAENYVPAAKRYEQAQAKQESMETEIKLLKLSVAGHSSKLLELTAQKAGEN